MCPGETLNNYDIGRLKAIVGDLGYEFNYTPQIASTMFLVEQHALTDGRSPVLFLTDHQTQGRGREGRVWLDKPKSSVLMSAFFQTRERSIAVFADLVALKTCLAVRQVSGVGDVKIKYPNDLTITDKKLGGILAQNIYRQTTYLGTSVGIGLNVHYGTEDLEGYDTDYGMTALDLHTPQPISRQSLVVAVLRNVRYLGPDAEVAETNLQMREDYNNLWRGVSSVLNRIVTIKAVGRDEVIRGRVVDTQVGKGILVDVSGSGKWFNQFDTSMKVRLLD